MTALLPRYGLYAITDSQQLHGTPLEAAVEQAIKGGARMIQYREKQQPMQQRSETAGKLAGLCRDYRLPLIINDDIELAARCGAAGVHLGATDGTVRDARKHLGNTAIIGASCYSNLELAQAAVTDGADYVAFGRFFPSRSKPDAVAANTDLLTQAKQLLSVPIVAIGGITPENGAALVDAGADMLAAIHGVFGQKDIEAAARCYDELFDETH